jgi:hypothetical protein
MYHHDVCLFLFTYLSLSLSPSLSLTIFLSLAPFLSYSYSVCQFLLYCLIYLISLEVIIYSLIGPIQSTKKIMLTVVTFSNKELNRTVFKINIKQKELFIEEKPMAM